MLAVVWNKNREVLLHRMDSIAAFCAALPASASDQDARSAAAADAHKLAGSLGMFGLSEGTSLAREIEHHVNDDPVEALLVADIPTLAVRLRGMIESFQVEVESDAPVRRYRLLVAESDDAVANGILAAAEKRGMQGRIVGDMEAARRLLRADRFDLLVLDLGTAELSGDGFVDNSADDIRDLIMSRSEMQVLALTSADTFEDRVTAAQVGAHGFLPKTVPVTEIVDTCERLLDLQTTKFKVLLVDDDVTILTHVKLLLEQHSIHVSSISDPRTFWSVLEETTPDLVVLDLEMPGLSGLELCRAVRNDRHWNRLPVVFLSANCDPQTVTEIFSAGADDFVSKPIIDIELTTRVRNRLDRDRLSRNLSDFDQLTGVRNRRSSNVVIANYLRLARRHTLPLSLAVIDLDKFKRVNDTYGHQAGDDVLQHLGSLLRQSFRSEDVVARWGGEEFVIAMFAMRRADAIERMANVLEALEAHEFESSPGTRFRVSFSAGLAEFPEDGADLHSLYRIADEALYRAKDAGRRRIYACTSTPSITRSVTDIAIVSPNVAVSAPLRHLLEMRGYSVSLFHSTEQAERDLRKDGGSARVVLVDEFPGNAAAILTESLRSQSSSPTIFLLASPETPIDGALENIERIAKPVKTSWLTQRLRRVWSR